MGRRPRADGTLRWDKGHWLPRPPGGNSGGCAAGGALQSFRGGTAAGRIVLSALRSESGPLLLSAAALGAESGGAERRPWAIHINESTSIACPRLGRSSARDAEPKESSAGGGIRRGGPGPARARKQRRRSFGPTPVRGPKPAREPRHDPCKRARHFAVVATTSQLSLRSFASFLWRGGRPADWEGGSGGRRGERRVRGRWMGGKRGGGGGGRGASLPAQWSASSLARSRTRAKLPDVTLSFSSPSFSFSPPAISLPHKRIL